MINAMVDRILALPRWKAILGGIGLAFVGFGLYELFDSQTAGKQTTMDVADIERGNKPVSRWLVVKGYPADPIVESKDGSDKDYYFPLVSSHETTSPTVFVRLDGERELRALDADLERQFEKRPDATPTFDGILQRTGLPPVVRREFEKHGASASPNAVVLDYGEEPAGKWAGGLGVLIMGTVFCLPLVPMRFAKR